MYYGRFGTFTAQPGRRDDLVALLVRAADLLGENRGCLHYTVATTDDPDTVVVVETWVDKAAHEASLEPASIRALIGQAMPLIAGMSDAVEFDVVGGLGLPRTA